jgi:hypothetical protein
MIAAKTGAPTFSALGPLFGPDEGQSKAIEKDQMESAEVLQLDEILPQTLRPQGNLTRR